MKSNRVVHVPNPATGATTTPGLKPTASRWFGGVLLSRGYRISRVLKMHLLENPGELYLFYFVCVLRVYSIQRYTQPTPCCRVAYARDVLSYVLTRTVYAAKCKNLAASSKKPT